MQCVDFYFDFISPYPWLASHQFGEVRECTATKFRFVPVLFAALLDHHSNMGPAEITAKRRYTYQDVQRWAAHLGLEFRAPLRIHLFRLNLCGSRQQSAMTPCVRLLP